VNKLSTSEYDKFFVRSPQADPSTPFVVPLIDAMIPKQVQTGIDPNTGLAVVETRSTTATTYQATLGKLGQEVFNTWRKRQAAKKKQSPATKNLLLQMPALLGPPSSLYEAHYVYRYAISDHMPIMMELQYA
jgi:hypothetical protein